MFKVGDRVEGWHGEGEIKYLSWQGSKRKIEATSVLVAFDKPFASGHDGNGGCDKYGFATLPHLDGRCYWIDKSELELADYELLEEASDEIKL